jgi:hypothetical protein
VSPGSDDRSMWLPDVVDIEREGILKLVKCAQAPSSSGTGRSLGNVVSISVVST